MIRPKKSLAILKCSAASSTDPLKQSFSAAVVSTKHLLISFKCLVLAENPSNALFFEEKAKPISALFYSSKFILYLADMHK